jgi:hypothetical protein
MDCCDALSSSEIQPNVFSRPETEAVNVLMQSFWFVLGALYLRLGKILISSQNRRNVLQDILE